jgi:hypothetical protein
MFHELIKTWCDGLMEHQIANSPHKEYNGGIMCPACTSVHGRCYDALYALTYMAEKTGDKKYLDSAKLVFEWGENNMAKADGSYVNDANNDWKGITVFSGIGLGETLYYHGNILDKDTKAMWTERFRICVDFMYDFVDEIIDSVQLNYFIATAALLALGYRQFAQERYKAKARQLAHTALDFIDDDGIIFGEGLPPTFTSPKGCRPVDMAYNVEESLGNLLTYAEVLEDEEVKTAVLKSMEAHMNFMLPDGSWDDSWGSRNNKWDYYGSRNSDGCHNAFGAMMNVNPQFGEVAYRNAKLMESCTVDGLLMGGPMYASAREPACSHHTFAHTRSIVTMLNQGMEPAGGGTIPMDTAQGLRYYKTIHVNQVAKGDWRASVSDYDYCWGDIIEGNATGGAITLLWHKAAGPVVAATMTNYQLTEPTNLQSPFQQPPACLTPRIEYAADGVYYRSINDKTAEVVSSEGDSIILTATGVLRDGVQNGTYAYTKQYEFTKNAVILRVSTQAENAVYRLPVISKSGDAVATDGKSVRITTDKAVVTVTCASGIAVEPIPQPVVNPYYDNGKKKELTRLFNPVGGFEAVPILFTLSPGIVTEITIQAEPVR